MTSLGRIDALDGLKVRRPTPVSGRIRPGHAGVRMGEVTRHLADTHDAPSRHHIHTVVRTPNGNDYGRDLLRQHHAQFDHSRAEHRHR